MLKRIIDGWEKLSFRKQAVAIIGTVYSLAGIGFGGIYCGFKEQKKTEPTQDYFYHQPHDTGRSAGVLEDAVDAGYSHMDKGVQEDNFLAVDSEQIKPDTAPAKPGKTNWLRYTVRPGDRFIDLIASEDPTVAKKKGKKIFVADGTAYQDLIKQFRANNNGADPGKWKAGIKYSVPDLNGDGKIGSR